MIMTEIIEHNGKQFKHTYSSLGHKIKNEDNVIYNDAIDLLDSVHTYTEVVDEKSEVR